MMDKKILIIDISSHQDPALFDYDLLATQVDGVILRAAYGTGSPKWGWVGADPAFETHYRELSNRGVPLGAYHYICEYATAEDQANVFLEAVAGKKFKLGYWCDVEYEKGAEKLTGNQVIRYMTLVEAELGKIGIYTGQWCWKDIMGSEYARYADRKLWMSAYTASPDNYIPHGWDKFWLWQYTSTGRLASYNGGLNNIDKNMFYGTREDYTKWSKITGGSMQLCHPLKDMNARISQLFGERPASYPTSKGHNGIDYAVSHLPVYAMRDGVVIRASEFSQDGVTDGKVGYGRHVRIQHDNGVSIYGHLHSYSVAVGDVVKEGQQIGVTGGETSDPNSGWSTGAHLHAEYRMDGVLNPVPGGYEYNAIDILPLLYIPTEEPSEPETVLYRVKVKEGITRLIIRTAPIVSSTNDTGYRAKYPEEYDIFEEKNGYGRISSRRWISVNLEYVSKIVTNPAEVTDSEKLARLWLAHPELH